MLETFTHYLPKYAHSLLLCAALAPLEHSFSEEMLPRIFHFNDADILLSTPYSSASIIL